MKALYAQYLKFQNDVNGNSRRGWWFTAQDGQPLGWLGDSSRPSEIGRVLPLLRAYRANDVFEGRELPPDDAAIPCHLLDGAETFGVLTPALYKRLASRPLITTCKGSVIATTGGVPVFGIRRWWNPRGFTSPSVDVLVPHLGEEITERVAIERLAKGQTLIADAWCPSYRGMNGNPRSGRDTLEVTRI